MSVYIHPTAVVDEGAQIGEGTKVWHFSHVEGTAKIGEKCSIGQNAYVGQRTVIGNGCKLQNNVSIYEGVTLGNGVFCGPSCVFTNDLTPRALFPKGHENFVPTPVEDGHFSLNTRFLEHHLCRLPHHQPVRRKASHGGR